MITAISTNMKGETLEKVNLDKGVFGAETSPMLLAQSVRVFLSNQRKAHAKTKSRGDVAKTSAKMYKQKGTGRARHGSYSAPIFVGGGIAFGPKGTQNYKLKISKAQNKLAVNGALSQRASEQKVFVINETAKFSGKAKDAAVLIKKINGKNQKVLVVVGAKETSASLMFGNIQNVTVAKTNQLNTYLVLANPILMMTHKALAEIK